MKVNRKENLLGYEIKIIPDRESGYFAVRFPDFPGVVTGGYSLEEAIKNAQEALELTMDSMKKHKIPPPKPKARFSGQFNVRVPKDLGVVSRRTKLTVFPKRPTGRRGALPGVQ